MAVYKKALKCCVLAGKLARQERQLNQHFAKYMDSK